MEKIWRRRRICIFVIFCVSMVAYGTTFPGDLKILNDFRKGLENSELLEWPDNGSDPCGPPLWPHVYCNGDRVSQIQVQKMGLKGPLPQNFNQLSKLSNLGLQRNNFNGKLPTFSGLSELEFAYLDNNDFDTIPFDFFDGLSSLRVMALDHIPLNVSTGWSLPSELAKSVQLQNLSLIECNLAGSLPEFLGALPSLSVLQLSFNRLTGVIPASFGESLVQTLWLNNQDGGLTGPIDVIASMSSLTQVWLHGNQFTGTIPANIGDLSSLKELNLNGNQLVGLIPQSLADMKLDKLDLGNNRLMGTIPKFKSVMGKITTKADVFSFGVVLMELLTGLTALDENRPEESRYLAEWFWRIKSSKEKLVAAIDPTLEVNEETFESISMIAGLAGHCTAREPSHRPEMGHAVNVLSLLVEKWKPIEDESDCLSGIDYNQPLPQMLKVWKESESQGVSYNSLEDSKGSIPTRPNGFAESFTSADGR